MSNWTLVFEKRALKDAKLLRQANLWKQVGILLDVIRHNPFQNPPPYEKLRSEFLGMYSRRINRQHRFVYQVVKDKKLVRILRMWTHYE